MLSAGFKFMCCSTEDDADNPKINWNENLLSMQNLQVRQEEINNQVTLTFVAVNNEPALEAVCRKHPSYKTIGKVAKNRRKLIKSLQCLSKASGVSVGQVLKEIDY